MGGRKEESIIIGDSKSDLGAAQNGGIDSILFYPPENGRFYNLEMLKTFQPTFIIHQFSQLLEIVKY